MTNESFIFSNSNFQGVELSVEDEKKIIEIFRTQMLLEIKKVEFLFYQNTKYYHERIIKIEEQLEYINKNKQLKEMKASIEIAIKELFKEINYMKRFVELNLKAKGKIIKKFTKFTKDLKSNQNFEYRNNFLSELENTMSNSNLSNAVQIISVQSSAIEKLFGEHFFYKYADKAIKILKDYGEQTFFTHMQSFYFGFFVGLMAILFILCLLIGEHFDIDMDDDAKFKIIFPMFRGYLVFILYYWYLGVNVYVWNKYHINYKLAFNFNDNHYSDVIRIFKRAAIFSFVFMFLLLCYMILRAQIPIVSDIFAFIPLELTPLCCWFTVIIYLFIPLKIFNWKGRVYLLNLFIESMSSFTHKIEFKHIWFTDQLTSLIGPLRDLEYTACYYFHYFDTYEEKKRLCSQRRPILVLLACFPHFVRFLQCVRVCYDEGKLFPSALNCGKYLFSILLAVSSYYASTVSFFSKTWLLIGVVSTIYSFSWDIKMDYGMLQKGANYPLRNKLSYSKKQVYYVALILNFFMRFAWGLTITPDYVYTFVRPEFFLMLLYLIEMFRRGMWNFFRVELKHIEICSQFKVCPPVSLPLSKNLNGSFTIRNVHFGENDEPEKLQKLIQLSEIVEYSNQKSDKKLTAGSVAPLEVLGLKESDEEKQKKYGESNTNYQIKFQNFLDDIQKQIKINIQEYHKTKEKYDI